MPKLVKRTIDTTQNKEIKREMPPFDIIDLSQEVKISNLDKKYHESLIVNIREIDEEIIVLFTFGKLKPQIIDNEIKLSFIPDKGTNSNVKYFMETLQYIGRTSYRIINDIKHHLNNNIDIDTSLIFIDDLNYFHKLTKNISFICKLI